MTTGEVVPAAAARALASMDQARAAIAAALEAHDADALNQWRDQAAAMQHYASRREEAAVLAADAGEIKVRAEAALGQLDAESNPEHRGVATPDVATPDVAPTTRAAWRRLGRLEEQQLEAMLVRLREDDLRGVTTAAAVRLVAEYLPSGSKDRRRPRTSGAERLRERRREFDDLLTGIEAQARVAITQFDGIDYDDALMPTRDRLHRLVVEAIAHLEAINDRMEGRS